jgi:uncharacterized protein (TIGR00730 family)
MKRICVFTGGNFGNKPVYSEAAKQLGTAFTKNNISLVYGGNCVGLMGAIADQVLALNGEAIGVIPKSFISREVAHTGLTKLHIVGSMHERKALMVDLSDAFIMMPGGIGTLDEFFEIFTWAKLRIHTKPIAILNTDGYYNSLLTFLDHVISSGFLEQAYKDMLIVEEDPSVLVERILATNASTETHTDVA